MVFIERSTDRRTAVLVRCKLYLRTAEAEASLVRTKARAEAQLLKAQASINGTRLLLEAAGIETQDHKTAFSYIKTLTDRDQLNIAVSYLSDGNVLHTTPEGVFN